jgi:two-component system sensor histidine kinase CiaH
LLLQIMVSNLIENALKYTSKEKGINVELFAEENTATLKVYDEGDGIAQNEKKKIFEKFYRIGNESTRTAKGTGLGLFLCKRIAHDHHAEIEVYDNHPAGSIFTVTFKT